MGEFKTRTFNGKKYYKFFTLGKNDFIYIQRHYSDKKPIFLVGDNIIGDKIPVPDTFYDIFHGKLEGTNRELYIQDESLSMSNEQSICAIQTNLEALGRKKPCGTYLYKYFKNCAIKECDNVTLNGSGVCIQCRDTAQTMEGKNFSTSEILNLVSNNKDRLIEHYKKIIEENKVLLQEYLKGQKQTGDSKMSYENLKLRAKNGGIRLAGRKFMQLARMPMAAAIAQIMDVSLEKAETLLNSELGKALSGATVSLALKMVPAAAGGVPDLLANELQEEAIANAGESVINYVTDPLMTVVHEFFDVPEELVSLPQETKNVVKVPTTVSQPVTIEA